MAALQAQSLLLSSSGSSSSSSSSSSTSSRRRFRASLHLPSNLRLKAISPPKLPLITNWREGNATSICTQPQSTTPSKDEHLVLSKIYALLAAIADRAEMHAIIGEQRNNWNHLLTNSVNSITLTATLMAGISSTLPPAADFAGGHALKISSVILFAAATGLMAITSKIQPSQLAEEQRNATRLWKELGRSIETTLALRPPTERDVAAAMDKVLALEKAYPLSLLPGMLEKFPAVVEPARWWPKHQTPTHSPKQAMSAINGWSRELEEEMRGILRVLQTKDAKGYLKMGNMVLNINKTLARSGPLLAGMAAVGSGLIGAAPAIGAVPAVLGVLAAAVNNLEHGAQVGMVFELFRNCAGFYRRLEEEIEANLGEEDGRRENGELFEMKVALQLGRSVSELRDFARFASPSPFHEDEDIMECAGKLF